MPDYTPTQAEVEIEYLQERDAVALRLYFVELDAMAEPFPLRQGNIRPQSGRDDESPNLRWMRGAGADAASIR